MISRLVYDQSMLAMILLIICNLVFLLHIHCTGFFISLLVPVNLYRLTNTETPAPST